MVAARSQPCSGATSGRKVALRRALSRGSLNSMISPWVPTWGGGRVGGWGAWSGRRGCRETSVVRGMLRWGWGWGRGGPLSCEPPGRLVRPRACLRPRAGTPFRAPPQRHKGVAAAPSLLPKRPAGPRPRAPPPCPRVCVCVCLVCVVAPLCSAHLPVVPGRRALKAVEQRHATLQQRQLARGNGRKTAVAQRAAWGRGGRWGAGRVTWARRLRTPCTTGGGLLVGAPA